MTCGILVLQPGIEPCDHHSESASPNTGPPGNFHLFSFDDVFLCCAEAFHLCSLIFYFAFDFLAFGVHVLQNFTETDGGEATASVSSGSLHSSFSSILS